MRAPLWGVPLLLWLGACQTVVLGRGGVEVGASRPDADAADSGTAARAVLLVTSTHMPGFGAADEALVAHLVRLGFSVERVDHALVDPTLPAARVPIIISSSVLAPELPPAIADAPNPLLTLENYFLPYLGATGSAEGPDFGIITTGDVSIVGSPPGEAWPPGPVRASRDSAARFGYARPSAQARVVATAPVGSEAEGLALFFGYERGDQMATRRAPGRRIGLFLRTESLAAATPEGLALFDAAVRWVAAP